jgi:hypothetical protein
MQAYLVEAAWINRRVDRAMDGQDDALIAEIREHSSVLYVSFPER